MNFHSSFCSNFPKAARKRLFSFNTLFGLLGKKQPTYFAHTTPPSAYAITS